MLAFLQQIAQRLSTRELTLRRRRRETADIGEVLVLSKSVELVSLVLVSRWDTARFNL